MERRDGEIRYRSLWPAWLSLEESVYKPLFRWLIRVLMTLCRMVCDLLDLLVLVMRRTLLRDTRDHVRARPIAPWCGPCPTTASTPKRRRRIT